MAAEAQSRLLVNCWLALPLYTGFFEDAELSSIRHNGLAGRSITLIMDTLDAAIMRDITEYPLMVYNAGYPISPISAALALNVLRFDRDRGLVVEGKYSLRPFPRLLESSLESTRTDGWKRLFGKSSVTLTGR